MNTQLIEIALYIILAIACLSCVAILLSKPSEIPVTRYPQFLWQSFVVSPRLVEQLFPDLSKLVKQLNRPDPNLDVAFQRLATEGLLEKAVVEAQGRLHRLGKQYYTEQGRGVLAFDLERKQAAYFTYADAQTQFGPFKAEFANTLRTYDPDKQCVVGMKYLDAQGVKQSYLRVVGSASDITTIQ